MSNVKYFVNKLNEMVNTFNPSLFSNIGKLENLKVYDVYNYCNKNAFDFEFSPFCEDMYTLHFSEMLKDNSLEWTQYARTSSHYFNSEDLPLFELYEQNTYMRESDYEKMLMVIDEVLHHEYNITLEYNLLLKAFDKNQITNVSAYDIDTINYDYTREELDDVIKELKNSILETVNSINKGYEWLQEFKDNQVEYFNRWIGGEL